MKGLILGILLSGVYVLGMVALFSTDYASEHDFLIAAEKTAVKTESTHTGFGTLVRLQEGTPAAANDLPEVP